MLLQPWHLPSPSQFRFFFPALPTVPSELVDASKEFVQSMGHKSSAQDFNCIQDTLDKRNEEEVGFEAAWQLRLKAWSCMRPNGSSILYSE